MMTKSAESTALAERWRDTWRLAGQTAPAGLLGELEALYAENHRAYHNASHVLDCLAFASDVRGFLHRPAEVELALWFHDSIYDPRRSDNEEKSADFANDRLRANSATIDLDEIRRLILATKHPSDPSDPDAQFVADIDLAILGSPIGRFADYDQAIRREYAWVPSFLYNRRRREVLRLFLSSDRIFHTAYFRERLESAARANLTAALSGR